MPASRSRLVRRTATGVAPVGYAIAPVVTPPTDPPPVVPPPTGTGRAPAYPTINGANVPTKQWTTIFEDDFDSYEVTKQKWNVNRRSDSVTSGYWRQDQAGMPVPPELVGTDAFEIVDSTVWLKNTRRSNPLGLPFVNSCLTTERPTTASGTAPKFAIPENSTSYTEALLWNDPKRKGSLCGFWLFGDTLAGDLNDVYGNPTVNRGVGGSTAGWPTGGEVDILEFVDNDNRYGENDRPYASLHWAADDNPDAVPPYPGTWLNREFMAHPDTQVTRTDLRNSWHTWGLYRDPYVMIVLIDGVELCRWNRFVGGGTSGARQGYRRWPGADLQYPTPRQWVNRMTLVLTYGIGGDWGNTGNGYTLDQLEAGKFGAKYVKVWQSS